MQTICSRIAKIITTIDIKNVIYNIIEKISLKSSIESTRKKGVNKSISIAYALIGSKKITTK